MKKHLRKGMICYIKSDTYIYIYIHNIYSLSKKKVRTIQKHISQYLMALPLCSIRSSSLSLIESVRGPIVSYVWFWKKSWIFTLSNSISLHLYFDKNVLSKLHKFSIGFKSGEYAGQSSTLMWLSSNQS